MLDASFLRTIPGLTILSPRDGRELLQMLQYSLSFDGPLAIRYPKGSAPKELTPQFEPIRFGKAEVLHRGSGIALLADGSMVAAAMSVAGILQESEIDATIVNLRFLKPLDEELLCELSATHRLAAALEENNRSGALGSALADLTQQRGLPWQILNTQPEDAFIPQGTVSEVRRRLGLDPRSIAERIKEKLSL